MMMQQPPRVRAQRLRSQLALAAVHHRLALRDRRRLRQSFVYRPVR